MQIDILTIFPQLFEGAFSAGMIQQAQKQERLSIDVVDLRCFTDDRHRTVDDRPYGGGEGMVLKPEPIFRAVRQRAKEHRRPSRVILLSPRGETFSQSKAQELSTQNTITLICGRYEGIDQRVADHLADEELSVGDFVLSGGEFAAMMVVDSVCRLLPGVLGNASSVLEDSFMHGLLDYPQYTRPEEFEDMRVPQVLLSGNHERISSWRKEQAYRQTLARRPDLLSEEVEQGKTGHLSPK